MLIRGITCFPFLNLLKYIVCVGVGVDLFIVLIDQASAHELHTRYYIRGTRYAKNPTYIQSRLYGHTLFQLLTDIFACHWQIHQLYNRRWFQVDEKNYRLHTFARGLFSVLNPTLAWLSLTTMYNTFRDDVSSCLFILCNRTFTSLCIVSASLP